MLPRIHAKQWRNIHTPQRLLRTRLPRPRTVPKRPRIRLRIQRVSIHTLLAVVRPADGRTSKVRRQDAEGARGALVGLHEPDEARAEHGVGGEEEGLAEGVEGGEVLVDEGREVVGGGGGERGVGLDAAEEEVVVEGHGGEVEEVGAGGVAGDVHEEGFGVDVVVFGAWVGRELVRGCARDGAKDRRGRCRVVCV